MERRGVAVTEVQEAIDNAGTTYPSKEHPDRLVVLGSTTNGRRLKVVVRLQDRSYVITVADRNQEDGDR